jgi:ABC-2 type transport system permease protein
MKTISVLRKTLKEQLREWGSLSMVLLLCPFFVFLYWLMSSGGSSTYAVALINEDRAVTDNQGEQVRLALENLRYGSGTPMLKLQTAPDVQTARGWLKDRTISALLVIPPDFSAVLREVDGDRSRTRTRFLLMGDAANPAYTVAAVLVYSAVDSVIQSRLPDKPPVGFVEEFLSGGTPRNEFDTYVPGLLILSITLLIFTTALPLVREREDKTLRRLRLSDMKSFDLLAGISLAQVIIGTAAILLTYLCAAALGFHSVGSLWAALTVAVMTVGSVVAIGLMTACFCKNATAVLTVGTLPFFLLMWFTGAAMPLPRKELFTLAGRAVAANDFLPPTHAVVAMNKVLSLGATLWDVRWEMGIMLGLTAVYFALGVWLFGRTQMRRM